jgi:hypothetical protein
MEAASQARNLTTSEYELKRVKVLGDVTRRFIQVVADQHALDLALTNHQLAGPAIIPHPPKRPRPQDGADVGLAVLCSGIGRRIMTRTASPSSAGALPT